MSPQNPTHRPSMSPIETPYKTPLCPSTLKPLSLHSRQQTSPYPPPSPPPSYSNCTVSQSARVLPSPPFIFIIARCLPSISPPPSLSLSLFSLFIMASASGSPCGACKFLRRKCAADCVFAPYFCSEQGPARFAAIHKVFGASNVSKLLLHVPVADRCEAVVTIAYEAQARIRDPVYGCVAHIFALQQQVPLIFFHPPLLHSISISFTHPTSTPLSY